jgi:hypothetical protein
VKFIPLFAALCVLTACRTEKYPQTVATEGAANVTIAPLEPEGRPDIPYRSPNCEGNREGQYHTIGNSHVRDASICVDRVSLEFMATGEFSVLYDLHAYDCDQSEQLSWTAPIGFFERTVPDQMRILERSLTEDIRKLSAECEIDLDPARFLGSRFADFYYAFGDGWWFSRLENGIVLTPEKGWKYGNVQKN